MAARELLLDFELPDADDERFARVSEAWAERLHRGIAAGIVTEPEARRCWRRKVYADVAA